MKLTPESFGGHAVTLILAVVGVAVSWGSNNARLDVAEQNQKDDRQEIAELRRDLQQIKTDVAVTRQWVEDQKRKDK